MTCRTSLGRTHARGAGHGSELGRLAFPLDEHVRPAAQARKTAGHLEPCKHPPRVGLVTDDPLVGSLTRPEGLLEIRRDSQEPSLASVNEVERSKRAAEGAGRLAGNAREVSMTQKKVVLATGYLVIIATCGVWLTHPELDPAHSLVASASLFLGIVFVLAGGRMQSA